MSSSSVTLLNRSHPIEFLPPAQLRPAPRNPRAHSKKQVQQIARSIQRFGFTNPILVSDENEIIAGHGRVEAAKLLGLTEVPTLRLSHLSPAERRAYLLADNKLALNAGWHQELLANELQALAALDFEVDLTGFSVAEIDRIVGTSCGSTSPPDDRAEDAVPPLPDSARVVTRPGDLWQLGGHRLLCADPGDAASYQALLRSDRVDVIFTDPPRNLPVTEGGGRAARPSHHGFEVGSDEAAAEASMPRLAQALGHAARACKDEAIAFLCGDWRHMEGLLACGQAAFGALQDLCVWNKGRAGIGTLYRSKHELVFVFQAGACAPTGVERRGARRNRTNVWDYAGVERPETEGVPAPTSPFTDMPVALVADALRDCSRQGEFVLDPFGGSGTTLIAAEKTRRRARLLEMDPAHCDVILRRFERITGRAARLAGYGMRFEDVAKERCGAGLVEAVR